MKHRIFIGMQEIAGYYSNLAEGLREQNQDVTLFYLYEHPFYKNNSVDLWWLPRIVRFCNRKMIDPFQKNIVKKFSWKVLEKSARLLYFLWAIGKHDMFIFGFGISFLPFQVDVLLIRAIGKKVICNLAHGTEARPPYSGAELQELEISHKSDKQKLQFLKKTVRRKVGLVRRSERWANLVIGAPYSTGIFATQPFINSFALGYPSFFDEEPSRPGEVGGAKILHSPSNPKAKGTERVRSAMKNIQAKNPAIEYIEVIGKPNSEVLYELSRCSFIVDQLYSDTPMAGFATEAAWFSKPTIVCGYGLQELPHFFPKSMPYPPSQTCHPDNLENAISNLVTNSTYRKQLGEAANQFVRTYWSREQVAQRYIQLLDGDIPADWYLDPMSVTYLHGAGVSEQISKKWIKKLIVVYGISSLGLSHRPDLERAYLEFAGIA